MRLTFVPLAVALAVQTAAAAPASAPDNLNDTFAASSLPQLGSSAREGGKSGALASEQLETELAGWLADAGQALEDDPASAGDHLSDRAKSQASGYLSGRISSGIEGWLGSYGRAQVTLGTGYDGDFSWGIDYIQPLYHKGQSTVLYALGSHRLDDRSLADVGVVYRFGMNNGAQLGTNLFVDQDLENGHSRASLGLEYMTPWWQVTGNYYTPLTDWKSTDAHLGLDFADAGAPLQERPARGYDLSLQGALPVLPQVGAEATVSHWMGDHVDVAGGQTTTEQDPWTTELTLNYQPVPLVTLSATQAFLPGKDDTSVRLQLSFNMDQSLEQQLQPVTGASPFGSAPDLATRFVNRNYRMVMDYREDPRADEVHVGDVEVGHNPVGRGSKWDHSVNPSEHVLLRARVTDGLGRPLAGVPVFWNLVNDNGGIHHGQILGFENLSREAVSVQHPHFARRVSNAEGYVYLSISDSRAEETLRISAELERNSAELAGQEYLPAHVLPHPVPQPRRGTLSSNGEAA